MALHKCLGLKGMRDIDFRAETSVSLRGNQLRQVAAGGELLEEALPVRMHATGPRGPRAGLADWLGGPAAKSCSQARYSPKTEAVSPRRNCHPGQYAARGHPERAQCP